MRRDAPRIVLLRCVSKSWVVGKKTDRLLAFMIVEKVDDVEGVPLYCIPFYGILYYILRQQTFWRE